MPMPTVVPPYPNTTTRIINYLQIVALSDNKTFDQLMEEKHFESAHAMKAYAQNHYNIYYGASPITSFNTTQIAWEEHPENIQTQMFEEKFEEKEINKINEVNYKNKTLQEIYSYKAMKLRKVDSISYEKSVGLKGKPYPWTTQQGMIGIEVEVENIQNGVPLHAFWDMKQDNSLRNHGAEFVSVPLSIKQIQLALEHLFNSLQQTNKPDFSNRTSIHIHVNCRDMTQDQIWNMCLLYSIFEKHFYKVAGTKRMNSIFCVPLFRTNQLSNLSEMIYNLQPVWHKYCGLNLLPLVNNTLSPGYGTIEFRHLYGTADQQTILNWINDILCIRQFALEIKKEELTSLIKEMNTTSSYLSLYNNVFAKGQKILTEKKDFEECISNLKRELYGNDYQKTIKKSEDNSHYWQTVQVLGIRG